MHMMRRPSSSGTSQSSSSPSPEVPKTLRKMAVGSTSSSNSPVPSVNHSPQSQMKRFLSQWKGKSFQRGGELWTFILVSHICCESRVGSGQGGDQMKAFWRTGHHEPGLHEAGLPTICHHGGNSCGSTFPRRVRKSTGVRGHYGLRYVYECGRTVQLCAE